ncbi:SDR family NAD(P)-dependent oxidoreductase [Oceanimonas baumannii]|uniref:Short-chain dehydrogenase n=1 Tax=Oceanimonas baumannii TaxID=129578 RepID=A0A235CL74_9GAMM|nr:SDR family NAD(P)-dependent oxidoreductase [Oceanimonas baumannii]OYD25341.1 short-chain dehydrogenase [Oceanimonas baumannii]TDW62361.1 short-subunit dehydrogenase [Oceanimonas baumannii]
MKRVLVTGASSGIGLQLATDYLADGWQVVACGRNKSKLTQALPGEGVEYGVFDINDREAVRMGLSTVAPVDLAILNAGTCEYVDDAHAFDADLFERVVQANLIGTANCVAAVLPRIKTGGRLALVSSAVTFVPLTRAEAYGASKAGVDYLARTLAVDLNSSQVAVSLVRPGFVDTPLTQKNDFPMPGRVSPVQASRIIRSGLARGKHEITFPSAFIVTLKLLSWLPYGWWLSLARRMKGNTYE